MSSDEEDIHEHQDRSELTASSAKKRRVQRACDNCRRKKTRCDGGLVSGDKCSNCASFGYECTYVEGAKKRGPNKGYVEALENRLKKLEALIHKRKLKPDGDLAKEFLLNMDEEPWPAGDTASVMPDPSSASLKLPSLMGLNQPTTDDAADADSGNISEEDFKLKQAELPEITDSFKSLTMGQRNPRFFGKSSGVMMVKKAMDMKHEYSGSADKPKKPLMPAKRPYYWSPPSWESHDPDPPTIFSYPPDDLTKDLIDLYFRNVNVYWPVLHRPTFEKAIQEELHLVDESFAMSLLLVYANGARYSPDSRVLLDGETSPHSAGWKWFKQVRILRKSLISPPSLYDIQSYSLCVLFLMYSSVPQSCWTMVGIGIRLAEDVGAHRKNFYKTPSTVEDEKWKRAFWVLVCLDRMASSALGRPSALQDEDFDLTLPCDCDDECWEPEDPKDAFKQPRGKPSQMSFFISMIKLNQILAFLLRTVYSINKSKILLGFIGQKWEQHIVAELDSALNKWVDSIPQHLKWIPSTDNMIFFDQSAMLYASYYHLQILVHRPFIPSPRKPSPLSFPSLAICTNAARSCTHVLDIQNQKSPRPLPLAPMAIFSAGVVLLLHIWGGKQPANMAKEMEEVNKCMQILKANESVFHGHGRMWDMLKELASAGDLPLHAQTPEASNKRERDSDSPASSAEYHTAGEDDAASSSPQHRPIAGTRRAQSARQSMNYEAGPLNGADLLGEQSIFAGPQPASSDLFALPIHSGDLGRLPLNGQINFDTAKMALPNNMQFTFQQPSHGTYITTPTSHPPSLMSTPPTPWYTAVASSTPSEMETTLSMDHLFFEQISMNLNGGQGENPYTNPSPPSFAQSQLQPTVPQTSLPDAPTMASTEDVNAMWSDAPPSFQADAWGAYIQEMNGILGNTSWSQ